MNDAAEEVEEIEVEEVEEEQPQSWPDDWRQRLAGDNEKELAHLGKYASPADIWTKARALEQKLSSGEYKQEVPFPEKGSDQEKADWLTARGIPDAPDKYEFNREVQDSERAELAPFLDFAHQSHMTPDQVNQMVDFFYQKYENDQADLADGDKAVHQMAEDRLRAEWGNEFRANMNRVESLVDTVPAVDIDGEKVKMDLLDSRMPDGTKLRSSPEAMQFLLRAALAVNPASTVVPSGGDVASSIVDEIEQIRETMRTDRKKYNRDERMQKRYSELLTALSQANPDEYNKIQQ